MFLVISKKVAYDFSCVLINLPTNLASSLKKWGMENISEKDIYTEPGKNKGRETEMHVTVKYGLHTNDIEEVKEVVEDFNPFDIELGKISKFSHPEKEYDVLKIDVSSKGLHKLNELIADSLETTDEWNKYKPHVTLAYVKKGTCSDLVGNKAFDGKKFKANILEFSPSKGNKQTIKIGNK